MSILVSSTLGIGRRFLHTTKNKTLSKLWKLYRLGTLLLHTSAECFSDFTTPSTYSANRFIVGISKTVSFQLKFRDGVRERDGRIKLAANLRLKLRRSQSTFICRPYPRGIITMEAAAQRGALFGSGVISLAKKFRPLTTIRRVLEPVKFHI